jgi:hypothetical protein
MSTKTYSSIADVIAYYVEEALAGHVDEYDTEAIAREITEWDEDEHAFVITEDGEADFWEIADRHVLSATSTTDGSKLHKTEAIASFGTERERTPVWIDEDEFPNLYVEVGGEFVEIGEDNAHLFDIIEGDHYMFVVTDAGDVAYIDRDVAQDAYVTGGVAYEHLSDAMTAARSPQSARNRADAKYRKGNVTQMQLKFYPGDADLLAWMKKQGPRATYIKRLIREDMERGLKPFNASKYPEEDRNVTIRERHGALITTCNEGEVREVLEAIFCNGVTDANPIYKMVRDVADSFYYYAPETFGPACEKLGIVIELNGEKVYKGED